MARVFDIQTSSSHAEVGLSWDRKYWATASLRLLLIYLRGCTPSKTQYRPNVVHSSPAQPGVLPGFGSRRDILKTRLMVQCDLIFSFPRALCDFPYCVHLKREVLTHRIEVPSVPDKSWLFWSLPRVGGICAVGAGPWCPLPPTMPLGCLSARGILSRYLPTRRVRSRHGSAVRCVSRLPL